MSVQLQVSLGDEQLRSTVVPEVDSATGYSQERSSVRVPTRHFDFARAALLVGERDVADISRYFAGRVFDNDTTRVMGEAFDAVMRVLPPTGQPAIVREVVANRVIEIVERGERGREQIARRALNELGVPNR